LAALVDRAGEVVTVEELPRLIMSLAQGKVLLFCRRV
jgi:hypothetical protein